VLTADSPVLEIFKSIISFRRNVSAGTITIPVRKAFCGSVEGSQGNSENRPEGLILPFRIFG
ncbi:MAG: hypothetical protein WAL56_15635, partial [Candidatus Sulfotelmatobacter sp.]